VPRLRRVTREPGSPAARSAPAVDARLPQLLLLGQALAGLVAGVLWWAATRSPATWLVGEPVVTSPLTSPVARDGVFAVGGVLLGIAVGVVVLRRGRQRPLLLLTAALAGALAGSLLAAAVGAALPPRNPSDPRHVAVSADGVLLLWPLAVSAVILFGTLTSALTDWVRRPVEPAREETAVADLHGSDPHGSDPHGSDPHG